MFGRVIVTIWRASPSPVSSCLDARISCSSNVTLNGLEVLSYFNLRERANCAVQSTRCQGSKDTKRSNVCPKYSNFIASKSLSQGGNIDANPMNKDQSERVRVTLSERYIFFIIQRVRKADLLLLDGLQQAFCREIKRENEREKKKRSQLRKLFTASFSRPSKTWEKKKMCKKHFYYHKKFNVTVLRLIIDAELHPARPKNVKKKCP